MWSKCRLQRLNKGMQKMPPGWIPRPVLNGSVNLRERWPGTKRNHMPDYFAGMERQIGGCLLSVSLKHCWIEPDTDRLSVKRYLSGTPWATGRPQPSDPIRTTRGSWCSMVLTCSVTTRRTNIISVASEDDPWSCLTTNWTLLVKVQPLRHEGTKKRNINFVLFMSYPGAKYIITFVTLCLSGRNIAA